MLRALTSLSGAVYGAGTGERGRRVVWVQAEGLDA